MSPQQSTDTDLVRCIACGSTYALGSGRTPLGDAAGCPKCGAVSWIAVALPRRPHGSRAGRA